MIWKKELYKGFFDIFDNWRQNRSMRLKID
jgi:hypothetical protein